MDRTQLIRVRADLCIAFVCPMCRRWNIISENKQLGLFHWCEFCNDWSYVYKTPLKPWG